MKNADFLKLDKLWLFFSPLFVFFLALDQLSKDWAVASLQGGDRPDFGFSLVYNDGIIFGIDLPEGLIYVLSALILGLGAYLVVDNKLWQDRWHLTALALLLSGAIGNLIDRIRFGYVIDFIKVYWWPTFNLADSFIVLAVCLFLWIFLIREEQVSSI